MKDINFILFGKFVTTLRKNVNKLICSQSFDSVFSNQTKN